MKKYTKENIKGVFKACARRDTASRIRFLRKILNSKENRSLHLYARDELLKLTEKLCKSYNWRHAKLNQLLDEWRSQYGTS